MTDVTNAPAAIGLGPGTSTRRIVVLTVVAVLLSLFLIGSLAAGWVLYRGQVNKVHRLNLEIGAYSARVNSLATANTSAFVRGMKAQSASNKALGLTYQDGYKAGISSVFAGFKTPWHDGTWYVVEVQHGSGGHTITERVDMTPCQPFYVTTSGSVYGLNLTEC